MPRSEGQAETASHLKSTARSTSFTMPRVHLWLDAGAAKTTLTAALACKKQGLFDLHVQVIRKASVDDAVYPPRWRLRGRTWVTGPELPKLIRSSDTLSLTTDHH